MKLWLCEHCGKQFPAYQRAKGRPRRYCSHDCHNLSRRKQPKVQRCLNCNKLLLRVPSLRTQLPYCSKSCQLVHMKGRHSPFWHGGTFLRTQPNGNQYYMVQVGMGKPYKDHPHGHLVYRARYRLRIETYLGRSLTRQETVVHLNGVTMDDQLENLYVFPSIAEKNKAFYSYHGEGMPKISNLENLKKQEQTI